MTGARRGLTKRSIAGVLWTGLSVGAEGLLQIVALMVLARLLAPAEFGLFAATMIVIGLATIFGGLGVAPAIVQRPVLEPRHVRTGFTLSVLLGLTMAGLVWAGAPLLARMFRLPELAPVVRATAVVFLLQGFSSVAHALAQRALRFGWLAGVHAAALTAGYVVVGPLLAWQGFGVWALIGALLVQNLTRMALLQTGQPHPMRPQLDRRAIAELLYFGGGFTLARIGNYLASQADKLVVGRWLGAQTLGVYVLAYQLVAAPAVLVGQVLDMVLFPTMALVQREPSRLARAYRSAVSICAVVALPISVMVALLAAEIIEVLLGGQWSNAVAPLQILAFGILFRTSYKLGDFGGPGNRCGVRARLAASAVCDHGRGLGLCRAAMGNMRRRRRRGCGARPQLSADVAARPSSRRSRVAHVWRGSCTRIVAGRRSGSSDRAARPPSARDAARSGARSLRVRVDRHRHRRAAVAAAAKRLPRLRCPSAAQSHY